jgi:hypothetical protein
MEWLGYVVTFVIGFVIAIIYIAIRKEKGVILGENDIVVDATSHVIIPSATYSSNIELIEKNAVDRYIRKLAEEQENLALAEQASVIEKGFN